MQSRDPTDLTTISTAWTVASYIVTASACKIVSHSGSRSFVVSLREKGQIAMSLCEVEADFTNCVDSDRRFDRSGEQYIRLSRASVVG